MAEQHLHHRLHVSPEAQRRLARRLMRRQLGIGIAVASVFLVLLLGLPLVNSYWPQLAQARIFGFPFSWLFLAVIFYPVTWLLSWAFIKASDRVEADCARMAHEVLDEDLKG